jgi:hypothetical protein
VTLILSWMWFVMAAFLFTACGDNGGNDTVLTGFSGVIIFGIIAYVIYRIAKKKTK